MAPIVGVRYEHNNGASCCEEAYNKHCQGDPDYTGPIAPLAGPVPEAARAAVDEGLLEAHKEGAWYNDDVAYSAAVGAVLMLKQELSRTPCASMLRVLGCESLDARPSGAAVSRPCRRSRWARNGHTTASCSPHG